MAWTDAARKAAAFAKKNTHYRGAIRDLKSSARAMEQAAVAGSGHQKPGGRMLPQPTERVK